MYTIIHSIKRMNCKRTQIFYQFFFQLTIFSSLFVVFLLASQSNWFSSPSSKQSCPVPINETHYERFCRQIDQQIHSQRPLNDALELNSINESIPYAYSRWKSSPILPRFLTPCEHAIYMHLLALLVERIFRKHKIQYMMKAATLLGK
jgi:hypothetical protein